MAGREGVGVVRTEQPLVIGEDLLTQIKRLLHPPRVAVGEGEVVAGREGVGVVRTMKLDASLHGRLVIRDSWGVQSRCGQAVADRVDAIMDLRLPQGRRSVLIKVLGVRTQ